MIKKQISELEKKREEIRAGLAQPIEGTAEEIRANTEQAKAEIDKLDAQIAELRQRLDIAGAIGAGTVSTKKIEGEERMTDVKDLSSEEYRYAFMKFVQTGKMAEEFRATALTSANTAVIPDTVLNKIVEKMEVYGNILPMVSKTAYPAGLSIPKGNMGLTASWVGEGTTSAKQAVSINTSVTFGAYKLQCRVAVSLEMTVKALSAFENALISNVSKAMTKAIESAIIAGDGNAKPKGIITEDIDADRKIALTKFDYGTLVKIEASLPQAYETGVYIMNKKTWAEFAAMVDSNGQPIARVNVGINGKPERTLLGRNVVLTDYMPAYGAAAAGDVVAFVYDLSNYVLNTGFDVQVRKYIDEDTDDEVTKATMLVDGKCVDTEGLILITKGAGAKA